MENKKRSMKRPLAVLLIILLCPILLTGCAGGMYRDGTTPGGWLYRDVNVPMQGMMEASHVECAKVGKAKVWGISIFFVVVGEDNTAYSFNPGIAFGDAGIKAAMKDGGITRIHHVDQKLISVLGIFFQKTIEVYGE